MVGEEAKYSIQFMETGRQLVYGKAVRSKIHTSLECDITTHRPVLQGIELSKFNLTEYSSMCFTFGGRILLAKTEHQVGSKAFSYLSALGIVLPSPLFKTFVSIVLCRFLSCVFSK